MKQYILFIFLLLCAASCTKEDMRWGDVIGLSTHEVTLNGAGEPVTVNTKGKSWWISTIEIDGKMVYHLNDSSENWNMPQTGKFYQKCDWLNVKVDDWTLNISADMNYEESRTFKIGLSAGDYFNYINGTQEELTTGKWNDNIGLSTKTVTLNGAGDPVTVTTEGKHWWITSIEVDGETLYNFYYDNTENRNMYQTGKFSQKCGWLNVSVDDWTLNISANMNYEEGKTFKIYLQAGDYHDCIDGTQEVLMTGGASDKIGLSTKEVTLDYTGSEVKIDTEGKSWWITSIEVEGETLYNFGYDKTENRNMYQTGKFNQQCDWLNVRVDDWTLYISADDNFRKDRTFKITLELGNYFDHISGTQKAKDR